MRLVLPIVALIALGSCGGCTTPSSRQPVIQTPPPEGPECVLANAWIMAPVRVLRTPPEDLYLMKGLMQVDLARPVEAQFPPTLPVFNVASTTPWIVGAIYPPRPFTKGIERWPKPLPQRVDQPYVAVLRPIAYAKLIHPGRRVTDPYIGPDFEATGTYARIPVVVEPGLVCSRMAFGPRELVRREGDRLLATVPAAAVVDQNGESELWVRDVEVREPLDSGQLPAEIPVYSRFLDGSMHRGACRRYFGKDRMPNDVRINGVVFSRGTGYQLEAGYGPHPIHGFSKLPKPQSEWEADGIVLPGSERVGVDYGFERRAWRTLTPRFTWKPEPGDKLHMWIQRGLRTGEDYMLYTAEGLPISTFEFRVPPGLLSPGVTYVLGLTTVRGLGYSTTYIEFDISPDAVENGPDESVPAAAVCLPRQ